MVLPVRVLTKSSEKMHERTLAENRTRESEWAVFVGALELEAPRGSRELHVARARLAPRPAGRRAAQMFWGPRMFSSRLNSGTVDGNA